MSALVKVKRDGPRGWHWIEAERFDPAIHELAEPAQPAATAQATSPSTDAPEHPAPVVGARKGSRAAPRA